MPNGHCFLPCIEMREACDLAGLDLVVQTFLENARIVLMRR
jgi:hypothetical protein